MSWFAFKGVHGFSSGGLCWSQYFRLFLRPETLLIAIGDHIGDHQNADNKIETRLTHGINLKSEELQMRQMRAFRDQQDTHKEENEKP